MTSLLVRGKVETTFIAFYFISVESNIVRDEIKTFAFLRRPNSVGAVTEWEVKKLSSRVMENGGAEIC